MGRFIYLNLYNFHCSDNKHSFRLFVISVFSDDSGGVWIHLYVFILSPRRILGECVTGWDSSSGLIVVIICIGFHSRDSGLLLFILGLMSHDLSGCRAVSPVVDDCESALLYDSWPVDPVPDRLSPSCSITGMAEILYGHLSVATQRFHSLSLTHRFCLFSLSFFGRLARYVALVSCSLLRCSQADAHVFTRLTYCPPLWCQCVCACMLFSLSSTVVLWFVRTTYRLFFAPLQAASNRCWVARVFRVDCVGESINDCWVWTFVFRGHERRMGSSRR